MPNDRQCGGGLGWGDLGAVQRKTTVFPVEPFTPHQLPPLKGGGKILCYFLRIEIKPHNSGSSPGATGWRAEMQLKAYIAYIYCAGAEHN